MSKGRTLGYVLIEMPEPFAHFELQKVICIRCETVFYSKNRTKKYCSHKCQRQAASQRFVNSKSSLEFFFKRLLYKPNRSNLTIADLIELYNFQQGLCALSGEQLTFEFDKGKQATNISIDRIDPTKGYTKENIQLVCYITNIMKNNFPQYEFIKWCKKIAECPVNH